MGAINFGTLTNKNRLAVGNLPELEEWEHDELFYYYELEETQNELKKYNWECFEFFKLGLACGYYEGFYLFIEEHGTKWIYNNTKEKQEALKELTTIKNVLLKLVKSDILQGSYPSWVTIQLSKQETLKQIKETIKEYKKEVATSYTERTAKQQNKTIFDIMQEV
jgi:hypothetical protein